MRNSGEWDLPICILTHPSSNFQPRLSLRGFPGGSDGKESACNVGDPGLIPGLGRSPGEGNGYSIQCSCPENLPWTGETAGLQFLGLHRVGQDWTTNTFAFTLSLRTSHIIRLLTWFENCVLVVDFNLFISIHICIYSCRVYTLFCLLSYGKLLDLNNFHIVYPCDYLRKYIILVD